MYPTARDFIDRFGRRVLTDGGQPGRDGKEGVGATTEQMQGRVAAALHANCGELNDAQLDEIIGWVLMFKTGPASWLLYEHDDGRQLICPAVAASFTVGEPAWHRIGPVAFAGEVAARLAGQTDNCPEDRQEQGPM